ncbi:general secretion pathway protein I [Escherichia coli DEC4C]|nr:general secretion pathway protein I [Escherichia coli DEC4C]
MTLLEVIVALVVFALAGMALMQASTQQAAGIGRMEEKVLAGWLADNQMVQLQLEKTWPEKWLGREDDQLRWHRMVFTLGRAGQRRAAAALLRGRGTAH